MSREELQQIGVGLFCVNLTSYEFFGFFAANKQNLRANGRYYQVRGNSE